MAERKKVVISFHKSKILYILFFIIYSISAQDLSFLKSIQNKNLKEMNSSELLKSGEDTYKRGLYNHTIQYLHEYLERNPKDLKPALILIKSYINLNQLQQAKEYILNYSKIYPEEHQIKIYDAMVALKENNLEKADKIIQQLDEYNLQQKDYYLIKGNYYLIQSKNDLADYFYKKYLSMNPDDHEIYKYLILFNLNQKNYSKVEEYLNTFKKQFPDNIEIYKLYGDYYYSKYLDRWKEPIRLLDNAYLNYKTYLNYIEFEPEIWNQLLYISYLLNDKNKILQLKNEYSYNIKNPLLLSNLQEYTDDKNLSSTLENLCNVNEIVFSCIRYDFFIKKNDKSKAFERNKYYLNLAINYKKKYDYESYYNLLIWSNFLSNNNIENIKEYLNYYEEQKFYEDYYMTLQKLVVKEPNNTKWRRLMEIFLAKKNQYVMYKIFDDKPINNIKYYYNRQTKNILVFNPYPLDSTEKHFKESDLIRNFINFFINNIEYIKPINETNWDIIKSKAVINKNYYLFYEPSILPILKEWEKENNIIIDYYLESYYRLSHKSLIMTLILRDSNGILINKEDLYLQNADEFKIIPILKRFILRNISLEGKFISKNNDDIIINLGKVDLVKENDIFKFQNNFYKVKTIYPYTSILQLIKGNSVQYTTNDIFVKTNRN